MSRRTMRVTLCVTVADMSDEERESDLAGMGGEEEYGGKLPDLRDYCDERHRLDRSRPVMEDVTSIAAVLANYVSAHTAPDMFSGTEICVTFEEASVSSAEWAGPLEGDRPADRKES